MTREEYIDFANALKNNYTIDFDKLPEFCDMAISALSTEGEYIKKEEALQALHDFWDECIGYDGSGAEMMLDNESVINSLPTYSFPNSAENKGDLISRQTVLDELEKWDWQELYLPIHFKQILDDVPSVENKGRWEKIWRTDNFCSEYVCSKCGCGEDYCTEFCPNCGADMRGKA